MTSGPATDPGAVTCPRCGVVDQPLLSEGTGPHAIKTSCAHCGRFFRWVSTLAPAERMARKLKARLEAMRKYPPSEMQLAFLRSLGDGGPGPQSMAEASERIEQLIQRRRGG